MWQNNSMIVLFIAELAQQKVKQIKKVDDLDRLFRLTISAPDENTARWVLDNYAA